LTGAILHRELLAPTQKLRTFIVRGSYGLLLAATYGVIYLIYWVQTQAVGLGGTPHQAVSQLASWYISAIVTINIYACLVFTPAYVAGAIAQEKDQRTIQDLLLTTIGDWEIVFSKLVGRLAHAAFALLAGLPMFAIGAMLGSVSPSMMVALAAMTVIWLVAVGSFSLLISLLVRRTRDAVVGTYTLGAMVLFGSAYAISFFPGMPPLLADGLSVFNPAVRARAGVDRRECRGSLATHRLGGGGVGHVFGAVLVRHRLAAAPDRRAPARNHRAAAEISQEPRGVVAG
jgi:ABC-type transport system involved in multi-copper enzyme maturation permease subunit